LFGAKNENYHYLRNCTTENFFEMNVAFFERCRVNASASQEAVAAEALAKKGQLKRDLIVRLKNRKHHNYI